MGSFLIPNAKSVEEVRSYRGDTVDSTEQWTLTDSGVLYSDSNASDQEVASRYAGFEPLSKSFRDWPLLPLELRTHAIHVRDFGKATQAEIDALPISDVKHVLKDVCRALALLVDDRLD